MDTMDGEPTRCRRTDGKKWRCSNTVLPLEKYCERHMHRGCKRSRKLVESSHDVALSSASSTKHHNTFGLDSNNESQNAIHGSISVSSNAQVVTIASFAGDTACDDITRPLLEIYESKNKNVSHGDWSRRNMEMSYDDIVNQRESSMCVQVAPLRGDESVLAVQKFFPEVSDISAEAAKISSNRKNDIIARGSEWKNLNVNGGLLFPGIHFSPDTVLQDRSGFRLHRVETDNESGRCQRTDGKKWRCSKDALSGQKYCDNHMHRGVKKKHQLHTSSHENAGFSPLSVKTAVRSESCKDGDDQKRSVSVMGIPLSRVSEEKKSTSSCSTDTTITDTALRGEEDNEENLLSLSSSGV